MNINSKKPKQIRTYKKIISVATSLFVKYGVQGTSMALIAKKSGIATGSIYNYFDSKEKLINEIFESVCKEAVTFLNTDIILEGTIRERFDSITRRQISFKLKFPTQFQFMTQYAYSPLILKKIKDNNRPDNHPMADVFADGRKDGCIQMLSDEELFFFLFGALNSWFLWKHFHNMDISEEEISSVIEMSWRAISTEKSKSYS
ncbi:MAG: TetR/AcrR family transcriptional regulator [Gammaproteobacteria bacterium]|nr:TetR/AcrR family transcriptional regulator [Gammaproteobacteria bacterium]